MTDKAVQDKISFSGVILSVQPRSNVWRYRLDNRTHRMTGYNIFLRGTAEGVEKDFSVAFSEKQQQKFHFHIGDKISGTAWLKKCPKLEYADYYRPGALKKLSEAPAPDENTSSPWIGEVPALSVYDWRGCRMLAQTSWKNKCFTCKWACMANVTIEYNWGKTQKYRFESFCYGPRSCRLYNMGKPRTVPCKDCDGLYDEGWLDEICTERRKDDDE